MINLSLHLHEDDPYQRYSVEAEREDGGSGVIVRFIEKEAETGTYEQVNVYMISAHAEKLRDLLVKVLAEGA